MDVKGTLVFNQNLFVQFLEQQNYLNDSYTQYKNNSGATGYATKETELKQFFNRTGTTKTDNPTNDVQE